MEFVRQSNFWSFNHVFQFNGAEAAFVFPCLNICLFLLSANVHGKKARNQTSRILKMQLLTAMGNSQMRHLFLPALTLLKPVELPAHQKALLLAHYCFSNLTKRSPCMAGTEQLATTHLPNTHGL